MEEETRTLNEARVEELSKQTKAGLWTIDKGINDGQVFAGEVDEAQKEFLRTTEWVE